MERVEDYKRRREPKHHFDQFKDIPDSEWYIVFHESYHIPFWQWLYTLATPKEFGHMFCFSQTGPLVVFIEPTHSAVHIEFKFDVEDIRRPVDAENYAIALAGLEGHTVVKVKHNPWGQTNVRHLMNFIPSCVTVIKIVLGLPAQCLTPYAYYKYLIRSGKGELVYGDEQTEGAVESGTSSPEA